MRIVIDARMVSHKKFGMSRYTFNLIKNLAEIDQENQYIILVQNDLLRRTVKAENFQFRQCRIKWLSLSEQWQLPLFLKKLKPDIFHATSFGAPVIQPCKTIINIHDLIHLVYPEHYGIKQKIYYNLIIKNALKRAFRVIALSAATKDDLVNYLGIRPDKIPIIYAAAEERFQPIAEREKIALFKKDNRLPDKFLLYIGNRKKHKNITTILKAFALFKQHDRENYYLVINGPVDQKLMALAKDTGVEKWLVCAGAVDDQQLLYLYNAAKLFIFPSLYEGFGLPVLEAMACGTPVITSNVSSLPEVVGDAAVMIDPHDHEALAGQMRKVLEDPQLAAQLSRKGLVRAKEFSWGKCAKQTLSVYQKIRTARAKE